MVIEVAGCVITNEERDVLLLHRTAMDRWELPGGKVEAGESPAEAAIRELDEELGVDVMLRKELGKAAFADSARSFEYTWFRAVINRGVPAIREPEICDALDYVSLEKMSQLPLAANARLLHEQIERGTIVL